MTGRRRKGKVTSFPRRRRAGYGISRLVALAGVLMLCFLFAITLVQMLQYNRLQKEVVAAEGGVAEKERRNESAAEEVARLEDHDYIEVDYLKKSDRVKVKVLSVDGKGKIGLSIRRALAKSGSRDFRREKRVSFEDKLARFMKESDERLQDLKRNTESKRGGRGTYREAY